MSTQKPKSNRKLTSTQALERINSINDSHCESDSQPDPLPVRLKRLSKRSSTPAPKRLSKKDATPAPNSNNNAVETDQFEGPSILKNTFGRNHSCDSFIQKIRTDEKMTRKPDWPPIEITKRLTYKQDKKYTERCHERSIHDNLLENSYFRSALNMGDMFFACIKTENLECEASNSVALRLVFLKIVSVS